MANNREYKCPVCKAVILPQSEYCSECGKKLNSVDAYSNTLFGKLYIFEENEVINWLYNQVYKKFYGAVKDFKSWLSLSSPVKLVEKIIKKLTGKIETGLKNKAETKAKNRNKAPGKVELFFENKQVIHIIIKVLCFLMLWGVNAYMLNKKNITYKAEPRIIDFDNYTVNKKFLSKQYEVITDSGEINMMLSLPKYYSEVRVVSEEGSKTYTNEEAIMVSVKHGSSYTIEILYDDNSTGTIEFKVK